MAIAKAKTLNEVERLNQMLKTGIIPGKELKKLRGMFQQECISNGALRQVLCCVLKYRSFMYVEIRHVHL